jgi:MoaA/NifB/PqqE/SkfB family radical SAM enzyme
MATTVFSDILKRLPHGRHVVSLQGEGEPTMHPQWWSLVDEVKALGHHVTTITNGYLVDTTRLAQVLDDIAVSVDTLDEAEATRIGRYKLPRVLESVERLIAAMGAERVRIATTDYGQDLSPLKHWVESLGIKHHVIQPLQTKTDYAYRYPDKVTPKPMPKTLKLTCRYLEAPIMRYYDLQGVEMPCCFIKDASKFASIESLRTTLAEGQTPNSCVDCRYLVPASFLRASRLTV